MSRAVGVVTRAKVNLSLEVLRRRPDGYHEIETILQSIDLADELRVEVTDGPGVDITCSDPEIPTDESNLCARALAAMSSLAGRDLGARIHIEKRIPSGAGLGGGSANAGGVMRAVEHILDLDTGRDELESAAAAVGSDVPFMLHGGTMLGRGRGERLVRLEQIRRGFFAVVKPPVSISTEWVYENLNYALTTHHPRINLNAVNVVLARFPGVTVSFRNVLEDVVCPTHPRVAGVLDELLSTHPRFASMTGSGSAVYAVYDSEEQAGDITERFSRRGYFGCVARPAKRAIELFEV